jgi:uncharacterized membrane protein YhiD involved in acid resistance
MGPEWESQLWGVGLILLAGIGIAVAIERLVFAGGITFSAVAVLFVVGRLERRLRRRDCGDMAHRPPRTTDRDRRVS